MDLLPLANKVLIESCTSMLQRKDGGGDTVGCDGRGSWRAAGAAAGGTHLHKHLPRH